MKINRRSVLLSSFLAWSDKIWAQITAPYFWKAIVAGAYSRDDGRSSLSFPTCDGHGFIMLGNRMLKIGGWRNDTNVYPLHTTNDVWESKDYGFSWKLIKPNTWVSPTSSRTATWAGRHNFGLVKHDGFVYIVGGDSNSGFFQKDIWKSKNGINWTYVGELPNHTTGLAVVSFKGKLWAMGGQSVTMTVDGAPNNSIYSSIDGQVWELVTDSAAWQPRFAVRQAIVFLGKIWLLGGGIYTHGLNPRHNFNDVWSSSDGLQWTKHSMPAWEGRHFASVFNFDDKMWIAQGTASNLSNLSDFWCTSDGENWEYINLVSQPIAAHASAAVVVSHNVLVFNPGNFHQIYSLNAIEKYRSEFLGRISGGQDFRASRSSIVYNTLRREFLLIEDNGASLSEFYSSSNGLQWNKKLLSSAGNLSSISNRRMATLCNFSDQYFVFGGLTDRSGFDVWHSFDGKDWRQLTESVVGYKKSYGAAVLKMGNSYYLIGGLRYVQGDLQKSDVWLSSDLIHWQLLSDNCPWTSRITSNCCVVFKGKIWIVGSGNLSLNNSSSNNIVNDIWESSDGRTWSLVTKFADFQPRISHKIHVFDDKLWIVGGINSSGQYCNDVWFSIDGHVWTEYHSRIPNSINYLNSFATPNSLFVICQASGKVIWSIYKS